MPATAAHRSLEEQRNRRIREHFHERLAGIAPLLSQSGVQAAYAPSEALCAFPEQPAAATCRRTIPVLVEGEQAGQVGVSGPPESVDSTVWLDSLVKSWSLELASLLREEALLEELSSSWESLEALYEVSSSLRLSNRPEELLRGLLVRATTIGPDLSAALWLIQPDGSLRATAVENAPPIPDVEPAGPMSRCISTRTSLVINKRTELRRHANLPEHLRNAEQVAMAPIVTSEGLRGVLELWRTAEGSEINSHVLRLIEALAHQAGLVMDNDRLNRAFVENDRIRRDIEIGSTIQRTLLFGRAPGNLPGLSIAAVSKPSQTVDGDFFDFLSWGTACTDVLVGDVMGKGIPAALLGAAAKNAFLHAVTHLSPDEQGRSVAAVLRAVHRELVPELMRLESFISLCYARFDVNTRMVEFVDCGHPRTIHYRRATRDWVYLEGGNLPLGFSEDAKYQRASTSFAAGDRFLFYSDGLSEAADADGTFFGAERLAEAVAENSERTPDQILEAIEQEIVRFTGSNHFRDDFTCVAVAIRDELPIELVQAEWPADLEYATAVREWAVGHAQRAYPSPADDLAYWGLELAVAETFTNIVEHSYELDSSRVVRIELQFYPERVTIRFVHWGKGFDREKIAEPSFDGSRDGGFGLFLVENTMDFVQYVFDPYSGHQIIMEKYFPTSPEQK
jgi:sigma-B regulation protein RsbU (phosphoserine phosphatase)